MSNPWRSGTFDDWYSGRLHDLWVEYKYIPKLGSIKGTQLLSALQYQWGSNRHKEGRNVAVIVGMPQGGIILSFDEWDTRIPIIEVEKRLLKRKQLANIITYFITEAQEYIMELKEYVTLAQ